MLFKTAIDILLNRFPIITKDSDIDRPIAKNIFNLASLEVYRAANWYFRKKTGQILLIPNYTTGTCSITQYDGTNDLSARTVTFSTSLPSNQSGDSAVIGRYFQPSGSNMWYKIINVDSVGTTAYLDTPVIETTQSGIKFTIWKRFYYLKSEADNVTDFGNWETGIPLDFKSSTDFTDSSSIISSTGQVSNYSPYGTDPFDDKVYSTGTISATEHTQTITGSGTKWLFNVESGDKLIVGSVEYTVKRVETDTQIITKQFVTPVISAGQTYQIKKNQPICIEFYLNTDKYRVVHYEYMDKGYPLIDEGYDSFIMPDEWFIAVADRAEMMIKKDKKDLTWRETLDVYRDELNGLKQKRYVIEPRFNQFSPKIHRLMPGRKGQRQ